MTQIIEGRYYKTRVGEVVGPIAWDDVSRLWRRSPDFVRNTGDYWHEDGSRYGHVKGDEDLIEEVAQPTPAVME